MVGESVHVHAEAVCTGKGVYNGSAIPFDSGSRSGCVSIVSVSITSMSRRHTSIGHRKNESVKPSYHSGSYGASWSGGLP